MVHADGKLKDNSSYLHPGCHVPSISRQPPAAFKTTSRAGDIYNSLSKSLYTHSAAPHGADFTKTMWELFTGDVF